MIKKFTLGSLLVLVLITLLSCMNVMAEDSVQYTNDLCTDSSKAAASSVFAGRAASRAFDNQYFRNDLNISWEAGSATMPQWIRYDFGQGTEKCIEKYVIYTGYTGENSPSYMPKSFVFQGSNDLSTWVDLDSRSNEVNWSENSKREYTFSNTNKYRYYRVYINSMNKSGAQVIIGEIEMMERSVPSVKSPTNLVATAGNSQVSLSWDAVTNATSYKVYRTTTSGLNYELISENVTDTTYCDNSAKNGTTYYYVTTAVNSSVVSSYSNEAFATPASPNILKVVLEVDEVLQLSVNDDLAINTDMTWTSSNTSVATIDKNGVVTALKSGNTIITCASKDGSYTDTINVLVVDDASDYRLAVDLKIGNSCRLTIDDYTNTVNTTWSSLNSTIATVSNSGKVKATSKGLTMITATDKDGNVVGQIYIRVR